MLLRSSAEVTLVHFTPLNSVYSSSLSLSVLSVCRVSQKVNTFSSDQYIDSKYMCRISSVRWSTWFVNLLPYFDEFDTSAYVMFAILLAVHRHWMVVEIIHISDNRWSRMLDVITFRFLIWNVYSLCLSMALHSFRPWLLFQFLNPIHNR
jgi:hypothetical protein